jgi:hypothetical protein
MSGGVNALPLAPQVFFSTRIAIKKTIGDPTYLSSIVI